jgi:hypothetical protein
MTDPSVLPAVPFTSEQARELGIARHELQSLVVRHAVRHLLRNAYVRNDVPDSMLLRARAAALVHPLGVVSDRLAAWVHGVDCYEFAELEILPPVEVVVFRGGNRTRRAGCKGGERDLLPSDVMLVGGVQVLTPIRTVLDLCCKLSRRDALAVLDAFMRLHGITTEQLLAEVPRYRRRRGVVQLRALIPLGDPRAESQGESWTRLDIRDAGLPAPEPQFWVKHHGRKLFRLDLAYPKSKVCIEYDGEEFHGEEAKEHDRKRRKWLRDHGWTVIVVTKDSFKGEALDAWLQELREALRVGA